MKSNKRIIPFLAAIILVAVVSVEARVFTRWSSAGNVARMVTNIGGRLAYKANLLINGSHAQISVFGLPESPSAWTSNMRSLSFTRNDTMTTLLGVQLSGKPILFQLDKSITETAAKGSESLPIFPQSETAFTATDNNAGMSITVCRSISQPEQVSAFYLGSMVEDGWHRPATTIEGAASGLHTFIRRNEVACIGVERINNSQETRITLLHKKLRIK